MLWVESGSQMTFKDKVAFIAGGTGGLGRAVTQAFLAEGAKVIVTYRKKQEFDDLKQTAGGSRCLFQVIEFLLLSLIHI